MEQKQLEKFKIWFDDYVASFYGDDEFVNANLKMKEDHSRRVCDEMLYLVNELNLSENQKRIAETIALFHDIGRFRQFIEHGTYNDPRSINHCLFGLEKLREAKVLDDIDPAEKDLIEKAIEYHGMRQLPEGLNGDCLLFSQLIRDADKLDIYRVVTNYYKKYKDDPGSFNLEIEFPNEPRCSDYVIDCVLQEKLISYNCLQTWNDFKLLQLGWIYDVNLPATLKRIKKLGYLEKIFGFLPDTDDILKLRNKIFEYIDSRIKNVPQ